MASKNHVIIHIKTLDSAIKFYENNGCSNEKIILLKEEKLHYEKMLEIMEEV